MNTPPVPSTRSALAVVHLAVAPLDSPSAGEVLLRVSTMLGNAIAQLVGENATTTLMMMMTSISSSTLCVLVDSSYRRPPTDLLAQQVRF